MTQNYERISEVRHQREVPTVAALARPTTTEKRDRQAVAVIEDAEMIAEQLRKDASFMRVLPRAGGWQKALLIDEVEVQKISATMLEAAERIEALEARATSALPKDCHYGGVFGQNNSSCEWVPVEKNDDRA